MKPLKAKQFAQCYEFLNWLEGGHGFVKGARVQCSCGVMWQLRRRRPWRALRSGDWIRSRRSPKMFWVTVPLTEEEVLDAILGR